MYQIYRLLPTARLSRPFNGDDSNTKPSVRWPISKIFLLSWFTESKYSHNSWESILGTNVDRHQFEFRALRQWVTCRCVQYECVHDACINDVPIHDICICICFQHEKGVSLESWYEGTKIFTPCPQKIGFGAQKRPNLAQNWHFGPNISIFGPFDLMPDQKTMRTSCLGGFLLCWYQNFYLLP